MQKNSYGSAAWMGRYRAWFEYKIFQTSGGESAVSSRQYVARFQRQQSKEQQCWILDEAYKIFTK
ncbi:MAG: hypothetical protein PHE09_10075 [Oscillospiraceae bacterium]|nr:hypothetical protein [Oscillospiraceae bacterium]